MKEIRAIRSKAPLRLGLAGGGTDVSPYCDYYGGIVLNATINMYAHCTIIPTKEKKITISLVDLKESGVFSVKKKLPTENIFKLCTATYNRIFSDFKLKARGFKIFTYCDAPVGSGLGSSSAMVVAMVRAFSEWLDLPLGEYDLALLAFKIEREDLKISGGKQDQYAAAFGGFNYIEFNQNDSIIVNPLRIKRWIIDELEASILLYYTGASRYSSIIIDEQKSNALDKNSLALDSMHSLKESAKSLKSSVLKGNILEFAQIIGESWQKKKNMAASISNNSIDKVMNMAYKNGAISGKVSGAGGGGFIFFVVPPEKKAYLGSLLNSLEGKVFNFNFTEGGCHSWKIYKA